MTSGGEPLPPKGKTSYSPPLWLTAVHMPRSWRLPRALLQSLQNVSHTAISPLLQKHSPTQLGGRAGHTSTHTSLYTLLVWLGDDRPYGVIRILNRDFLDLHSPTSPQPSSMQV